MGSLLGKISEETPKYRVLTSGHAGPFQIREYSSNIVAEVTYDASGNNRGGGFMILANYIGALGNPRNVKAGAAEEGQGAEAIAMTAPVLMVKEEKEEEVPETIAMTAPVLLMKDEKEEVAETIAMTAPVLMTKKEDDAHEKHTATQPSDADASSVDLVKEGQTEAEEKKKSSMMTMQFVLPSKYTSLGQVPRPIDPRVRIREVPPKKYGVVTFNGIANEKVEEKKVASLREALHAAGFKVTGQHILAQYNPPWTIPFLRTNEVMLPIE